MDFFVGSPRTRRQSDLIWVVVDRLTQSTHFFLVKATYLAEDYAEMYIKEIVRMHGVPLFIISDSGTQFSYNFWKVFQSGLGTKLKLSSVFHPHTNGLVERTI